MEEQRFTLFEFFQLELFLGSLTFLLGLIFQLGVSIRQDKKLKLKAFLLVVVTRVLTISTSFVLWLYWQIQIDVMFGFILLPALFTELVFSPLLLKLFGYELFSKRNS